MRCAECGRSIRGETRETVLGRKICQSCDDTLNGRTFGLLSGSFGVAATTPGFIRWIRRALGRERR